MEELLSRGVEQIIGREELEKALKDGRKLRIKFGVDPTRPDIHLGHAVALRKLRQLQDMGHTVIFLMGDYTTKIGDPSGKSKTRPMLSDEEIAANVKTYLDQVGQILDVKKAEIRRNSEWYEKLTFAELIQLASQMSVAQLIEREDFANRLASGTELSLHELLYPLMQAYDSVMLKSDVEFGGTDQLFNMLAGRALQKKMGQRPQAVFTAELLVGTDGAKKMSKSLDNYIALTDMPVDMYGKVMSLPDNLIAPYYKLCTEIDLEAIDGLVKRLSEGANPRDSKASLAREIVRMYHGEAAALKAEEAWNKQFREGGMPEDMPEIVVARKDIAAGPRQFLYKTIIDAGFAISNREVTTLVEQGGIRINGRQMVPEAFHIPDEDFVLQVGKRRYLKLRVK